MKETSLLFFLLLSCSSHTPHDPLTRQLRQCYTESDSYTGKEGKVQGKMTVKLLVTPNGKVKECKIVQSDFPGDYNLNACVQGVFKSTQLEKTDSGHMAELIRPVTFQPVKQ